MQVPSLWKRTCFLCVFLGVVNRSSDEITRDQHAEDKCVVCVFSSAFKSAASPERLRWQDSRASLEAASRTAIAFWPKKMAFQRCRVESTLHGSASILEIPDSGNLAQPAIIYLGRNAGLTLAPPAQDMAKVAHVFVFHVSLF